MRLPRVELTATPMINGDVLLSGGRSSTGPIRFGADDSDQPEDHSRRLVYYEFFATLGDAIHRERQLKTWQRRWKVDLIESVNPRWDDLSGRLVV